MKNEKNSKIRRILKSIETAVYPVRCPYCDKVIEKDKYACDDCKRQMPEVPISSYVEGGYLCTAPFMYIDIFANAVKLFKFSGRVQFAKPLALEIVNAMQYSGDTVFDYVTCVPMHKVQKRERGFNQSELLAKECAKLLGTEYIDALEKFKQNQIQHTLKGNARRQNVKGVYRAINKELLKGKKVLIVDDIVTTGSTLAECCKILDKCGCRGIQCAAVCRA